MNKQRGQDYKFGKSIERIIPAEEFAPTVVKAINTLASLDHNPVELVQMLFSREELEWAQKSLKSVTSP